MIKNLQWTFRSTSSTSVLLSFHRGSGRKTEIFSVVLSQGATLKKKPCWGCSVVRKCLSDSQKLLGKMSGRLTKGCTSCAPAKWAWNGRCPPWFSSASTGSPVGEQEYSLLAGILVLSLKIFILRIHVYIGLLILYCNIRWAAETSRGWGIYF